LLASKLLNKYEPLVPVVWLDNKVSGVPSLFSSTHNLTTVPAKPGSSLSCSPSKFKSFHTLSPILPPLVHVLVPVAVAVDVKVAVIVDRSGVFVTLAVTLGVTVTGVPTGEVGVAVGSIVLVGVSVPVGVFVTI